MELQVNKTLEGRLAQKKELLIPLDEQQETAARLAQMDNRISDGEATMTRVPEAEEQHPNILRRNLRKDQALIRNTGKLSPL